MTVAVCHYVPAEYLKDDSVCGLSILQVHKDLLWGVLRYVLKRDLLQVLGAQPQEDGPETSDTLSQHGDVCICVYI